MMPIGKINRSLSHTQFESCEDGVGLEVPYTGHLACHAEATYAALICAVTQTQTTRTFRVDEVRYEALLTQLYFS